MAQGDDPGVAVFVVGDVFVDRDDPRSAVEGVKSVLDEADVLVGNLEAAVSAAGEQVEFQAPWLRTRPEAVEALSAAGFDAMTLANNHAMDYGVDALVETLDRLEDAGITVTGAGRTREEADGHAVVERAGVTVGVLGFDATPESSAIFSRARPDEPGLNVLDVSPLYPEPHVDLPEVDGMVARVERAAAAVDVLLVYFHFGIGYTPTVSQRFLAARAATAGADCVVGTNAHVLQGVTVHDGTPVLYGLSHFFWDSITDRYPGMREVSRESVLAEVTVTGDGVAGVALRPVVLDGDDDPRLPEPGSESFDAVADRLVELSEAEGTTLDRRDDRLVLPL